jgi:phage gpG-like protein
MARRRKNRNADKIRAAQKEWEKRKDRAAREMAVEAQQFFDENFDKQGFQGRSVDKWPKRSKGARRNSRKILIDTGALRNSIHIRKQRFEEIVIAAEGVSYARAHNYGATITVQVTPKMKRYFWAMYSKTGDQRFKWMALTKKSQFQIDLPQRKFMGNSPVLTNRIRKVAAKHLKASFHET